MAALPALVAVAAAVLASPAAATPEEGRILRAMRAGFKRVVKHEHRDDLAVQSRIDVLTRELRRCRSGCPGA